MAGIKYVIDDQNTIVVTDFLDNVVQAMYGNRTALIDAHIR